MNYQVRIEKRLLKRLEKIQDPSYSMLKNAILELSENPRPIGYIKLKGRNGYRIRVGDYRIIYSVNDIVRIVDILNLGNRKEVYKFK